MNKLASSDKTFLSLVLLMGLGKAIRTYLGVDYPVYSHHDSTFSNYFSSPALNPWTSGLADPNGKNPDFVKLHGFLHGYDETGLCPQPGSCDCIHNL